MAPTSVVQQTFWDRIPNATSKVALLGRARCTDERPRPPAAPPSPVRISKRKQSRPARSPATTDSPRVQCDVDPSPKARRLSLDHHLPARRPLCAGLQSRAFRLSFSDEYLRNPHQYVQALITSEGQQLALPAQRPSPSASLRPRRSLGARPRSHPSAGSRRARTGRFHNLQLEQPVAADAQSDNDDSSSVTTAASDLNDLADTDSQLPATPVDDKGQLRQAAPGDAAAHANSPSPAPLASDDKHGVAASHDTTRCSTEGEDKGDDDGAADNNKADKTEDDSDGPATAPADNDDNDNDGNGYGNGNGAAGDDGSAEVIDKMDDADEVAAEAVSEKNESQPDRKRARERSGSHGRRQGRRDKASAAHSIDEYPSPSGGADEGPGPNASDGEGEGGGGDDCSRSSSSSGADGGDSPEAPEVPLAAEADDPAAVTSDNIPSYQRLGQILADDGDDVSNIVPRSKRSTVKWTKAYPIEVRHQPMADTLAAAELHCCSVLRILPAQYLTIKQTLLREGVNRQPLGSFKKRDAQRLCRIDVNKTSKLYEWYVAMGWLPGSDGVYANPQPPAGS